MNRLLFVSSMFLVSGLIGLPQNINADQVASATVLLDDDFERDESQEIKDEVGNGWNTNSRTRAAGNKQVDLIDGTMHIQRHAVADHGVSVTHEVAFADAIISMRFRIGPKDDLGINIADMNEKSVHAGHICMAQIRPKQLQIKDLKNGLMNLTIRTDRKAGKATPEQKTLVKTKIHQTKIDIAPNQWHDLVVKVV
ncbi:MAG: hypothetical protein AAF539_10980, partial [Planctomycetota bacterium]